MNKPNRRILLIDDMPSIHEDFRKVLAGGPTPSGLDEAEAALFGATATVSAVRFELDCACQGPEGLAKLEQALRTGRPYAMAFVDMRMPPGWDGVETIHHLWQKDPQLQVVVCTAYTDYSWDDLLNRLDARDRLLILKNPFDMIEVRQLANTLTAKWEATRQVALKMDSLEQAVQERTREIARASEALQAEITERRQLEAQLLQSEKLASIGQLAAGVAHEINIPIGYLFSNFSPLEDYLNDLFEMLDAYENAEHSVGSTEIASHLKGLRERIELSFLKEDIPTLLRESKDGMERVRRIVNDLKDFSRVDSQQNWEWVDLHRGIDSTLTILAHEIKYKADVVREYGPLPDVECVPSQLNQVIMNLVLNAAQATKKERGQITIRTGMQGEQMCIAIADDGCGISKEALPRIFDPFFTTKPIGQGTGLGLSLSYGIVQMHNGRITVDTEVGRGTTFHITLPVKRVAP